MHHAAQTPVPRHVMPRWQVSFGSAVSLAFSAASLHGSEDLSLSLSLSTCIYIYIYIYIDREIERERDASSIPDSNDINT